MQHATLWHWHYLEMTVDQGCNINNWIQRAASYNEPRLVIACRLWVAVVALKITFPRLNMHAIDLPIYLYIDW